MKIKTALILCAGFGKRLHPLTSKTPKPLLKINKITLLERTLNIIKQLEFLVSYAHENKISKHKYKVILFN